MEVKAANNDSAEAGLSIVDMLKQIEVPRELRSRPKEAAKFQMEQLRLKVNECTSI